MGVWNGWLMLLRILGGFLFVSTLWVAFFWNTVTIAKGPLRVLMVGDPQIMGTDGSTYGDLNVAFNDLYMRYIMWRALSVVQPTHVVVLGDLVSSHDLGASDWEKRVRRYRWIMQDVKVPMVSIAGNHDIGYGAVQQSHWSQRFERDFGTLNGELALSENLSLVWVNSMVLDGDNDGFSSRAAWKLRHLEKKRTSSMLLLTHVPLHKPAGSCPGDQPEIIRSGSGAPWSQNLLSPETTARILRLNPEAIFSGHDHVGCVCKHHESITEYTLRAIQGSNWGYTGVYVPPRQFAGTVLLHNTPFIVFVISIPIYLLIVIISLICQCLFCKSYPTDDRSGIKRD